MRRCRSGVAGVDGGVSVVLTRHQFEEMTRDLIALFGEVSCG